VARAETAALVALLTLNDKGFSKGLSNAEKNLGKFESTSFRVGQNIGNGFKNIASNLTKIAAVGAVGGIGLLVKSVQEASDLNEQINKSTVVFGKASKEVLEFSKTTADGIGIAQSEALEAAGAFGNMFKTTGLAEDKAAEMSTTLVTLAADMASFNNEDPSEMLDKLRSGLSGEAEPLRRFGVLLSEAAVKEEAYATGIAKRGEMLTEAQKVQARYSLILKQTAVQQGDFARTSDSLANVQRRITGNLRDAAATIGTALLPQVAKLAVKFNTLLKENKPAIEAFAATLPGAFDKALAFAEKIPWKAIGDGLRTSAEWGGKLLDVFLSIPPEAQTFLIALAGLNKLSGGAITGIVSELAKGAIKGVLGITAGTVHINAATATLSGAGGAPGTAAGAVGAAGATGRLAQLGNIVMKVAIVGIAADVANTLKPAVVGAGITIHDALGLPTLKPDDLQWPFGPKNTPTILPEIFGGNGALGGTAPVQKEVGRLNTDPAMAERQNITNERLESIRRNQDQQKAKADALNAQFSDVANTNDRIAAATEAAKSVNSQTASNTLRATERLEAIHGTTAQQLAAVHNATTQDAAIAARNQAAAFAIRDRVGSSGALVTGAVNTVRGAVAATTAAARAAGQQSAAAIRDKDLSVTVNNTTNVSTTVAVRDFNKTFNSYKNIYRTVS
jgi:hypothetical protein